MIKLIGNKLWQTEFTDKNYGHAIVNCFYDDVLNNSYTITSTCNSFSDNDYKIKTKHKLTKKEIFDNIFGLYCLMSIAYFTGEIITFIIISIAKLIIAIIKSIN